MAGSLKGKDWQCTSQKTAKGMALSGFLANLTFYKGEIDEKDCFDVCVGNVYFWCFC